MLVALRSSRISFRIKSIWLNQSCRNHHQHYKELKYSRCLRQKTVRKNLFERPGKSKRSFWAKKKSEITLLKNSWHFSRWFSAILRLVKKIAAHFQSLGKFIYNTWPLKSAYIQRKAYQNVKAKTRIKIFSDIWLPQAKCMYVCIYIYVCMYVCMYV